jgi:hypothetical protein
MIPATKPKVLREPAVVDKPLKYELRTYLLDLACGKCSLGRMRPTRETVSGQTAHTCNNCGRAVMVAGEPYPRTVIERTQVPFQ